jgi:nucleoside-diphosphate-sugar epimerase
MILITTAGKVGSDAARLLTQRDESVRVLVRNPEKATALRQLGVDVAEGDPRRLGVGRPSDAGRRERRARQSFASVAFSDDECAGERDVLLAGAEQELEAGQLTG